MVSSKNEYIGYELSWDRAVELFPDLWVVFKDCIYNGIDFEKGTLVDVLTDSEISNFMIDNWSQDYYIDRTTEGLNGGYVHGYIKDAVIE